MSSGLKASTETSGNLVVDERSGPIIAVHGGAGRLTDEARKRQEPGLRAAVKSGGNVIAAGGPALRAVEEAVAVMEDDVAFNAGYGSVLNAAGKVELDAGIMDGRTLDVGAVAGVRRFRTPVRLAARLITQRVILLAKEDAERFAVDQGFTLCRPGALIAPERRQRQGEAARLDAGFSADTVGAVAVDVEGNLAAATSTGGLRAKPVGRIGDSPLPGCGFYADNESGAVSVTGIGESIARYVLARRVLEKVNAGEALEDALRTSLVGMAERLPDHEAGVIAVDRHGKFASGYNTAGMGTAWWRPRKEVEVRW